MSNELTYEDVKEYQDKAEQLDTIGEFKDLGRELRDEFGLTDKQAIDILNGKSDEILEILNS